MHCAALTVSGGLLSWGQGGNGCLGQKEGTKGILSADNCYEPKPVIGLDHVRVVQVALAGSSGVALCAGHEVFSWGCGDDGILGLGHTEHTPTPQPVAALMGLGVVEIACGTCHAMARTGGGELFSWGSNDSGRTGHGTTKKQTLTPTRVEALAGQEVAEIACGYSHSVARTADDRIFVWGCGDDGRLGLGDTKDKTVPTLNEALSGRGLHLPRELGCYAKATIVGTSMRAGGHEPWGEQEPEPEPAA
jgi:alpha-tubulin suppressor-like RCC1 family protein